MSIIKKEIYHEINEEITKLWELIKSESIPDTGLDKWLVCANINNVAELPLEIIKKINFYYGRAQQYKYKVQEKITHDIKRYYQEEKI